MAAISEHVQSICYGCDFGTRAYSMTYEAVPRRDNVTSAVNVQTSYAIVPKI